jgi:hypothetical protein
MHYQGVIRRDPPILKSAIEIALMDYSLLFTEPKQGLFMY